jgi:hypothetical protein
VQRVGRQQAGRNRHHVAHAALQMQLAFYKFFGKGANLPGAQPRQAGPVRKRHLDRSAGRTKQLARRQLYSHRDAHNF